MEEDKFGQWTCNVCNTVTFDGKTAASLEVAWKCTRDDCPYENMKSMAKSKSPPPIPSSNNSTSGGEGE